METKLAEKIAHPTLGTMEDCWISGSAPPSRGNSAGDPQTTGLMCLQPQARPLPCLQAQARSPAGRPSVGAGGFQLRATVYMSITGRMEFTSCHFLCGYLWTSSHRLRTIFGPSLHHLWIIFGSSDRGPADFWVTSKPEMARWAQVGSLWAPFWAHFSPRTCTNFGPPCHFWFRCDPEIRRAPV